MTSRGARSRDEPPRVLVVDDDPSARQAMVLILEQAGHTVLSAESASKAVTVLRAEPVEVALVDLRLGKANGIELMVGLKEIRSELSVIVVTGAGTIETAVEAMKLGADNFLTKPVAPKNLIAIVAKGIENRALRCRADRFERLGSASHEQGAFGRSQRMARVLALAESVAARETTVLLTGETGSGKNVLARWIHEHSPRIDGPFVELNCAAFQKELVESELFGHEKGSFSGASERKLGLVEAADGGTLLLDEVGELELPAQAKLLKVLETRRFRRVGGVAEIEADVRLLAATNRDLEAEIGAGRFRRDLFFRLAVFEISVPPLRERPDDVAELAASFAAEFRAGNRAVSAAALERLVGYDWPGNVRELRNVMERAAILAPAGEPIDVLDLPRLRPRQDPLPEEIDEDDEPAPSTFREAEAKFLESALRTHGGNIRATARALGIARATLYRKMERYRLTS